MLQNIFIIAAKTWSYLYSVPQTLFHQQYWYFTKNTLNENLSAWPRKVKEVVIENSLQRKVILQERNS